MTEDYNDQSREGPSVQKLFQLFKLLLPQHTKTLARLKKFSDLNIKKLNQLKNLEIKGLIIDVDDCIAKNHGEILPQNAEHLKKLLNEGFKIVLYSNAKKSARYEILPKEIEVLTNLPAKPDIEGFKFACKKLDLPAKNVAMVGDNYITDAGSLQLKIPFIKVRPLQRKYDTIVMTIAMTIYNILREFYDIIARIHDFFRKEKPLTSKDLEV